MNIVTSKTWWIGYGPLHEQADGRFLPRTLGFGVVDAGGQIASGAVHLETFQDDATWRVRIRALGGDPPEDEDAPETEDDPLPSEPYARLARIRYDREVGGITLPNGMSVYTTRETQAQLSGTVSSYSMGLISGVIDWKAPSGWVEIDEATVQMIAQAVAAHVQRCFSSERRTVSDLDAMSDPWTANVALLFEQHYEALS